VKEFCQQEYKANRGSKLQVVLQLSARQENAWQFGGEECIISVFVANW